uniref:Uncharacterized protein n=1 Tax=Phaeomonas parva TaxID=124430 RepID=A0A7S1XU39_9STRA|mmetsp:Transcript_39522/g.123631  ORF Transcript_39522/g.123631 Transcript_39522/m.123631 type:complete len:290 (+) Transcript_39522:123-992(+)
MGAKQSAPRPGPNTVYIWIQRPSGKACHPTAPGESFDESQQRPPAALHAISTDLWHHIMCVIKRDIPLYKNESSAFKLWCSIALIVGVLYAAIVWPLLFIIMIIGIVCLCFSLRGQSRTNTDVDQRISNALSNIRMPHGCSIQFMAIHTERLGRRKPHRWVQVSWPDPAEDHEQGGGRPTATTATTATAAPVATTSGYSQVPVAEIVDGPASASSASICVVTDPPLGATRVAPVQAIPAESMVEVWLPRGVQPGETIEVLNHRHGLMNVVVPPGGPDMRIVMAPPPPPR